jgi:hypothetical protein
MADALAALPQVHDIDCDRREGNIPSRIVKRVFGALKENETAFAQRPFQQVHLEESLLGVLPIYSSYHAVLAVKGCARIACSRPSAV